MIKKFEDSLAAFHNGLLDFYQTYEMTMKVDKISDKFGDIIGIIADNIACICMYPESSALPNWKQRICALCKKFIDIEIEPKENNTPYIRRKYLTSGVVENLDEDYGAVLNHFKTVNIHRSKYGDENDTLKPCKSYEECYKKNKGLIRDCINSIINYVSEQNYEGLRNYINNLKLETQ